MLSCRGPFQESFSYAPPKKKALIPRKTRQAKQFGGYSRAIVDTIHEALVVVDSKFRAGGSRKERSYDPRFTGVDDSVHYSLSAPSQAIQLTKSTFPTIVCKATFGANRPRK
jgi:hypothetical protein